MKTLVKVLGSALFTVFISGVLIVVLAVSTFMESVHGTSFAQEVFYQTLWFDILLFLLWINIFCSTILRFPFQKKHVGFLITHIGILCLLIGAFIAKSSSFEGEIVLYEGEMANVARQFDHSLAVVFPNQEQTIFDLDRGDAALALTKDRLNTQVPFCPINHHAAMPPQGAELIPFKIVHVWKHSSSNMIISQGKENAPANRALSLKVKSAQLGLDMSSWLIEQEPGSATPGVMMTGPVKLTLRQEQKASPVQKPVLRILDKENKELQVVEIDDKAPFKDILIKKTGMVIKGLVYFPYAIVHQRKIVNYPEGRKPNPALEFDLVDRKGHVTHEQLFAFFPDLEEMPPGIKGQASDVKFQFDAGTPEVQADLFDGPQIILSYNDKGVWRYQVKVENVVTAEGDVVLGERVLAKWADLEFSVLEALSRALVTYQIVPTKDHEGVLAVGISVPSVSGDALYWVREDRPVLVRLPKGDVYFALAPKTAGLPFSLGLKKFRKIDYPGTMDAAGFESDVVLQDPARGVTLERTISMNYPLVYEGYKIFQSSYFVDQTYGQASVLSVAKNPGIPWIYIGSFLACLGALVLFYAKGFRARDDF